MRKKSAKVIRGEYIETEIDEGPTHPSTQVDKSSEFQSELLPARVGRTDSSYDFSLMRSGGMRLA